MEKGIKWNLKELFELHRRGCADLLPADAGLYR